MLELGVRDRQGARLAVVDEQHGRFLDDDDAGRVVLESLDALAFQLGGGQAGLEALERDGNAGLGQERRQVGRDLGLLFRRALRPARVGDHDVAQQGRAGIPIRVDPDR